MATCETCGNEYDKAFRVIAADGGEHTFDSLTGVTAVADRA